MNKVIETANGKWYCKFGAKYLKSVDSLSTVPNINQYIAQRGKYF